jgi:hypothetical protein
MPAFFTQDDLAAIESVVKALRKHLADERRQADRILREPVSISRAKATTMRAAVGASSDAKQRGYEGLHNIIIGCGYWPRGTMCQCEAPRAETRIPENKGHYEIGSGGHNPT